VILASLAVAVTGIAYWLHQTLLDTDAWVETAAPVIEDPQVQADVAAFVGRSVVEGLDVERRTQEALPPQLEFLAPPIAAGVQDVVTEEARAFVASPRAEQLWIEVNAAAHREMVGLLRGEAEYVYLESGEVTLNALPLVSQVVAALRSRLPELFSGRLPVPTIEPGTPADESIAQMETAFGRDLPPDFGQIELVAAPRLEQASAAVRLFDRLVVVLFIATAALVAGALLLSPRRLRTLVQLGAGAAVALVVVLLASRYLEDLILDGLQPGSGASAARATISSVLAGLTDFARVLVLAGLLIAIAAYLAMKADWVRGVAQTAGGLASRGTAGTAAWRARDGVLARHLDGFRLAGVVVGLLVLVAWSPGWGAGLVLVLAVLAYELALGWLTSTWPWRAVSSGAPQAPSSTSEISPES
jgi:hypothetical protein